MSTERGSAEALLCIIVVVIMIVLLYLVGAPMAQLAVRILNGG